MRRVAGVTALTTELNVHLTGWSKRTVPDIAEAVDMMTLAH